MRRPYISKNTKIELAMLFAARRETGMSIRDAAYPLPAPKETWWRWQEKFIGQYSRLHFRSSPIITELKKAGVALANARELIDQRNAKQKNHD